VTIGRETSEKKRETTAAKHKACSATTSYRCRAA